MSLSFLSYFIFPYRILISFLVPDNPIINEHFHDPHISWQEAESRCESIGSELCSKCDLFLDDEGNHIGQDITHGNAWTPIRFD